MDTVAESQTLFLYGGPCDGYAVKWESEGCEHSDEPHVHIGTQWPDPLEPSPLLPMHLTWITENAVTVRMASENTAEYERDPGTSRWSYNPS